MIIDFLVCRPDGSQAIEPREVPDDWFDAVGPECADAEQIDKE